MSDWKIIYTTGAAGNLQDIHDYIAHKLLAPESAQEQVVRIIDAITHLDDLPFRHPVYPHERWKSRGVHYLVVDNFIVLYYPDSGSQAVTILRIMYYRQSPLK